MDIDDILNTLNDHSGIPQETRDLQELTRLWVIERSAPEILQWPEALMDRVLDRIRKQIELVEDQTGSPDPKANFRLIIIQTELERFKYLVRAFLRTRIAKIDTYLLHYTSSSPEARAHLSAAELQYASTHVGLLHQHYHSSFLSQFPASLRNLDDKAAGGISMIDSPDVGKAVFARALRDMDGEVEVPGTDIRLAMERGAVVVARWSAVKDLVVNGVCELL